jgi:Fe-S-cluster-containing hydrogenase component 2
MDGEGGAALINEENCMGCGLCLVTCDVGAMSLKEKMAEDFVKD